MKVEDLVLPNHARRGAHAVLFAAQGEQDRPLGVIGVESARAVGTVIVNEPRRSHNDPGSTLLDPLHMPNMAPGHPTPQPADAHHETD